MTAPASPVADQWQAAARHAAEVVTQLSAILNRPRYWHPGEVPGPIGERLQEWSRTPTKHMCAHVSTPQPVMGIMHKPGRVWCQRCVLAAIKADHKARPRVCDGCLTDGHATFREHTIQAGPVLVWGNVCAGCSAAAGVTE